MYVQLFFHINLSIILIPPTGLPYIFNKFYRGESGITGGSGLGLSIVKGYIDIHKGQVEASNVTGKGANIFIRIPSMLPLIENF